MLRNRIYRWRIKRSAKTNTEQGKHLRCGDATAREESRKAIRKKRWKQDSAN
jgi:hypothetical protein